MSDLFDIEHDFPQGLLRLGHTSPGEYVLSSLTDVLGELQGEVEGAAHQPDQMREAYAVITERGGRDVTAALVNESGVLFASVVYGSQPHFPPWNDPELVEWADERGIPPFAVALAVAEHGTPPHAEIPNIVERYEGRIAASMAEGLDEYLRAVL